MIRNTEEKNSERRNEIMDGAQRLYETQEYASITLKEISQETSISRPSIYNYFRTRDEIFLGLLTREYEAWIADLAKLTEGKKRGKKKLAEAIAETLEERKTMLRIQCTSLHEIEENSDMQFLVAYKKAFVASQHVMHDVLLYNLKDFTEEEWETFQYTFFPFTYGIYHYVYPTAKQQEATRIAGRTYIPKTIRNIVTEMILKLI